MADIEEDEAQARLEELEAAVLQDVQKFGACSLGDKVKIHRLTLAVQEKLSKIRALTRDLELLFEELDSDEERQRVAVLLTRHKAEYERIQQAFKEAALQQRRRATQSAADERKELLAGAADPAAKQRALQTQAEMVEASEGVTEGLRRTRQVLAEQLEHTSTTLAAMEQSHTQLGKTKEEYHTQAGMLKQSKGLLGTLNWQQTAERVMLWVGLAIFFLVVAYIVQKRAGYFLPSALSPTALLGRATGYIRGSPKAPAQQRAAGGAPPAPPPLHRTGQPPGLPPHFTHREEPQGMPPHFQHRQPPQQQQWAEEWDEEQPATLPPHFAEQEEVHSPPLPPDLVRLDAPAASAEWDMGSRGAPVPPPPPTDIRPPAWRAPPPSAPQAPARPPSEGGEAAPEFSAPPAPELQVHPPGWDPAWQAMPPGVAPPAAPQHLPRAPAARQAPAAAEQQGEQPEQQQQQQPEEEEQPPQPKHYSGYDPVSEAVARGAATVPPVVDPLAAEAPAASEDAGAVAHVEPAEQETQPPAPPAQPDGDAPAAAVEAEEGLGQPEAVESGEGLPEGEPAPAEPHGDAPPAVVEAEEGLGQPAPVKPGQGLSDVEAAEAQQLPTSQGAQPDGAGVGIVGEGKGLEADEGVAEAVLPEEGAEAMVAEEGAEAMVAEEGAEAMLAEGAEAVVTEAAAAPGRDEL